MVKIKIIDLIFGVLYTSGIQIIEFFYNLMKERWAEMDTKSKHALFIGIHRNRSYFIDGKGINNQLLNFLDDNFNEIKDKDVLFKRIFNCFYSLCCGMRLKILDLIKNNWDNIKDKNGILECIFEKLLFFMKVNLRL